MDGTNNSFEIQQTSGLKIRQRDIQQNLPQDFFGKNEGSNKKQVEGIGTGK